MCEGAVALVIDTEVLQRRIFMDRWQFDRH